MRDGMDRDAAVRPRAGGSRGSVGKILRARCRFPLEGSPQLIIPALPGTDPLEDARIPDLPVAREQQHLREHLGRSRIVVREGQEQPAPVLRMHGDDRQRGWPGSSMTPALPRWTE